MPHNLTELELRQAVANLQAAMLRLLIAFEMSTGRAVSNIICERAYSTPDRKISIADLGYGDNRFAEPPLEEVVIILEKPPMLSVEAIREELDRQKAEVDVATTKAPVESDLNTIPAATQMKGPF